MIPQSIVLTITPRGHPLCFIDFVNLFSGCSCCCTYWLLQLDFLCFPLYILQVSSLLQQPILTLQFLVIHSLLGVTPCAWISMSSVLWSICLSSTLIHIKKKSGKLLRYLSHSWRHCFSDVSYCLYDFSHQECLLVFYWSSSDNKLSRAF